MDKQKLREMWGELSKLRQKRGILEKKCERSGRMLGGYLIFRKRLADGGFARVENGGAGIFSYLSYLKGGVSRHRYVRGRQLAEVMKLTGRYREFNQALKEIRRINKKMVSLLEGIKTNQTLEVEKYVFEKNSCVSGPKRTK